MIANITSEQEAAMNRAAIWQEAHRAEALAAAKARDVLVSRDPAQAAVVAAEYAAWAAMWAARAREADKGRHRT